MPPGSSFHFLYASFWCLSLVRSSLFIHAGLLPPLIDFLQVRMVHSWAWRSLKLFSVLSGSWTPPFMFTAAKVVPDLHSPSSSSFSVGMRSSSVSFPWLLSHFHQKVSISTFQRPPGLPVPCCVALPADVGVTENPHEDQDLQAWGFHQLSEEGLPQDLLPCIPDQAICSRYSPQCHHNKAELHESQLPSHKQSSLPFQSVLAKLPVPIHGALQSCDQQLLLRTPLVLSLQGVVLAVKADS